MSAVTSEKIVEFMPSVIEYKNKLSSLSRELQKTVLTGKISSLDETETLFDFMEKTHQEFSLLQEDSIKNLAEENLNKLSSSLASRAQVVIDVLVRNLFERTADVGFLATDNDIVNFLQETSPSAELKESMRAKLHEYILKYSVYEDIIILNAKGEVVANVDTSNTIKQTRDPIFEQVLRGNHEFCELFRHSDLQPHKKKSLIYASKISSFGVLCLCFNVEEEMGMIFEGVAFSNMEFALFDSNGSALSSSTKASPARLTLKSFSQNALYAKDALSFIASSKGYQGYKGQNWYGFAKAEYKKSFKSYGEKFPIAITELEKTGAIPKKLKEIKSRLEDIVDDLSDVVINGEIIASKRRTYALNPVLDNIRKVSESIQESIKESIENVYITASQGHLENLSLKASLCLDIMDRNLYERANDCRWWALTTEFRRALEGSHSNPREITSILKRINSLYTVYTNLFIYDTSYTVVAVSNESKGGLVGTKVDGEVYTKTLANTNSQHYFVSNFSSTALYDHKKTYIYSASICNFKGKNTGGIGIVFDSTPQFQAILDDVLDASNQSALFCENDGTVIAVSSGCTFKIGDTFLPIEEYKKAKERNIPKIFQIDGKNYFIGMAKSLGYREYKRKDNYTNTLYCAVLAHI